MVAFVPLALQGIGLGLRTLGTRTLPAAARGVRGLFSRGTPTPTAPPPSPTFFVNRSGQAYSPIPTSNALVPRQNFPRARNLARGLFFKRDGSVAVGKPLIVGTAGTIGGKTIAGMFGDGDAVSPTQQTPAPTADMPPFEKQTSGGGMTPAQLDQLLLQADKSRGDTGGDRNIFQGVSNVLSDPDRLQKIITGIALLEGTPVEDAVTLGSAVDALSGTKEEGKIDTEIYDTELGKVVDYVSSEGSKIRQYASDPRYQILDRGTVFEQGVKMSDARRGASEKQFIEFSESVMNAQNLAAKVDEVLNILEEDGLGTGRFEQFITRGLRLGGGEIATKADLLESLQTQLATLNRMPGSGSTSDLEFQAYRDATIGLGRTEDFNKSVLRKVKVASRILDSRMSYVDEQIFENGKSFSQAMAEFSKPINEKDALAAGELLDFDAVIFDYDDAKYIKKGGTYLFLNPNDRNTFNTIETIT